MKPTYLALVGASVALLTMAVVSQGCVLITSDSPLDGGDFTGNETGPIEAGPAAPNACNECLFQGCTGQWSVCQNSSECMSIYRCATKPGCDDSCVDACYLSGTPAGQKAYLAIVTCDTAATCSSCSAACQPAATTCAVSTSDAGADGAPVDDASPDAGSTADSGSTADRCSSCTETNCSVEKSACAAGTPCDQYSQCVNVCEDIPCIDKCGVDFASGSGVSAKLSECVLAKCTTACGL